MKLAFIVQRYGREVTGGSESLARQLAERLARSHEIDVLTTTARDYVTWKNEYPAAEEKIRGVRIVRFGVEQERNLEEFNHFSDWIYANPHTKDDELKWLSMQGPVVPKLVEYLKENHGRYDLLIFFTYLYYPTYHGIQVAPERSLLVPTAHDEPALKLEIYKEVFEKPTGFLLNTEAEELLVLERFAGAHKKLRETIGMGIELLDPPDTAAFRKKHKLGRPFLLYAGRIDEGKGVSELITFAKRYVQSHGGSDVPELLLIGNLHMRLPPGNECRYLGFLPEDEKLAAMAAAQAVVIPSRYESLSITALEAFSVGVPIVVNGHSKVLVDHCRKANAGLYYSSYEEFEGIVDALSDERTHLARALGRQGQQYIKENFGWEKLLNQYERAFREAARPGKDAAELPPPRPPRERESRDHRGRRRDRDERKRGGFQRPAGQGDRPAKTRGRSLREGIGRTPLSAPEGEPIPLEAPAVSAASTSISEEATLAPAPPVETVAYHETRESHAEGATAEVFSPPAALDASPPVSSWRESATVSTETAPPVAPWREEAPAPARVEPASPVRDEVRSEPSARAQREPEASRAASVGVGPRELIEEPEPAPADDAPPEDAPPKDDAR